MSDNKTRMYVFSESDRLAVYQELLAPYNPHYSFTRFGDVEEKCSTMAFFDINPNELDNVIKLFPSVEITMNESGGAITRFIREYKIYILDQ